jgi:hypothetical protein
VASGQPASLLLSETRQPGGPADGSDEVVRATPSVMDAVGEASTRLPRASAPPDRDHRHNRSAIVALLSLDMKMSSPARRSPTGAGCGHSHAEPGLAPAQNLPAAPRSRTLAPGSSVGAKREHRLLACSASAHQNGRKSPPVLPPGRGLQTCVQCYSVEQENYKNQTRGSETEDGW